jgi:predicted phosphodiesterase
MKLAVLADFYANSPTLNAVVSELPPSIDTVVSLGDFVGLMRFPQGTVAVAREHTDYAVKGNHDVVVLE